MAKKTMAQSALMENLLSIFRVDDIRHLPEAVLSIVLSDHRDYRTAIYNQFMELHRNTETGQLDLSRDLFQYIYETELAERDAKKQDFTPYSVSLLASRLSCPSKALSVHEPTAGNGSMIIATWHERMLKESPWQYKPSNFFVDCFELSSRSLPLLLLNLSLRGIVGEVVHGDVLEQTAEAIYLLVNVEDDSMAFSEVIKVDRQTDLNAVPYLIEQRKNEYIKWRYGKQ